MCQDNITNFEYHFYNAIRYYQYGETLKNNSVVREGVFRVADSFMRLTNITFQCYTVY